MRKNLSRELVIASYLDSLDRPSERAVNFRGLSAALGCAHTNLYNFFADWDALRWAGVEEILERLGRAVREGAGPVEAYARFALDHPAWYRLLWFETLPPPSSTRPAELAAAATEPVFRLLAEYRPQASAEALREAVDMGHDMVHGALAKALSGRLGDTPAGAEDFAARTAGRAMAAMKAFLESESGRT